MATYAIGDLQGCYDELMALLEQIQFDPSRDKLWFCGDIVNRGSGSLDCLRAVKQWQEQGIALTVLGNHDLHLLAVAHGYKQTGGLDTLDDILNAPDAADLLRWLRQQPLLHHDKTLGWTLIHAGLPPQWSLKRARKEARRLEKKLASDNFQDLLANMYGNLPKQWSKQLAGVERSRFAINCFTRMRFLERDGSMAFKPKGPPGSQRADLEPWFDAAAPRWAGAKILFGHWSALGAQLNNGCQSLDCGCIWGGSLAAYQLETGRLYQTPSLSKAITS